MRLPSKLVLSWERILFNLVLNFDILNLCVDQNIYKLGKSKVCLDWFSNWEKLKCSNTRWWAEIYSFYSSLIFSPPTKQLLLQATQQCNEVIPSNRGCQVTREFRRARVTMGNASPRNPDPTSNPAWIRWWRHNTCRLVTWQRDLAGPIRLAGFYYRSFVQKVILFVSMKEFV